MKAILLIFAVIYTTNAGLTDGISSLTNSLKEGLTNIENTVKTDVNSVTNGVKNVIKVGEEIGKGDATFGKLPRTPVPQLIEIEGYPVESHYLTTSDGYILNIFRIPHGKSGKKIDKVVYLQHGLLAASTDWVLFGQHHGLAYLLADEGYDVWLGNVRGNTYSRNHTTLNPDKDEEFWKFSWHEIGMIDIPEMIDFILAKTGKKTLYHVGHSQGTTSFYVMASMRPEYNTKVQHHISLAPIAFMNHLFSPLLRLVALGIFPIGVTLNSLGQNEFMPDDGFLNLLTDTLCSESVGKVLCKNALFATCGFSPKQLNSSAIPLIMAHYPAGAATRQIFHYAQEVNSGKFCQYDFGLLKNPAHYGQISPPDYDLSKITTSVTLIYGANDWLAAEVDVERLSKQLKNLKESYLIPQWNHVDFVFGNDAPKIIYSQIITTLSKF